MHRHSYICGSIRVLRIFTRNVGAPCVSIFARGRSFHDFFDESGNSDGSVRCGQAGQGARLCDLRDLCGAVDGPGTRRNSKRAFRVARGFPCDGNRIGIGILACCI